jgi:branched-chain amino acid aminotransferase
MNGKLCEWRDAKVHVLTHALHYGTGIFEGIRCFDTEIGPAIFRLREHVARFFDSARIYMMNIPYDPTQISEGVKETVSANGLSECYIRPLAYYGYGEMGVNPLPNKIDVAIATWPWESYLGKDKETTGLKCQVSSWRRVNASIMPPQAKCTANYANCSLAKIEAVKAGYDEAIMLNLDNMVAEATAENIFRVKSGILSTPPASDGALRGITRDTVIEIAKDLGIEFRRNSISREELYTADELFLTGTAAGISPIREVDGRFIDAGKWPITRSIIEGYNDVTHGRNSKYLEWLEPIGEKSIAHTN